MSAVYERGLEIFNKITIYELRSLFIFNLKTLNFENIYILFISMLWCKEVLATIIHIISYGNSQTAKHKKRNKISYLCEFVAWQ